MDLVNRWMHFFTFYLDSRMVTEKFWDECRYLWVIVPILAAEVLVVGFKKSSLGSLVNLSFDDRWDLLSVLLRVVNVRKMLSNFFLFGLVAFLSTNLWPVELTILPDAPLAWRFIFAYLLYDFLRYWSHRLKHNWSVAWLAHEFHHSSNRLTLWTSYRVHPLDFLFSAVLVFFPAKIFLGKDLVYSLAFTLVVSVAGYLNHSRVDVGLGWLGRWVLVGPRFHHLHHSRDLRYQNSNYGEGLVIWDRLFGTYSGLPESIESVQQGLKENPFEGGRSFREYFVTGWRIYPYFFGWLKGIITLKFWPKASRG